MAFVLCARTCIRGIVIAFMFASPSLAEDKPDTGDRAERATVVVADDETSFTLKNNIITARVSKRSGDLASLEYKGFEVLTDKSGHAGAYWSHDTAGGVDTVTRVTIDPTANGGERGEVSVKGISGGKRMGHGPGAGRDGDFPADIEIRYSLGRDDSGIYTYCTFDHLPSYPAATMTEARFCAKLADTFDWMTLDAKRDKHFPADLREGDKYIYTAVQSEHPSTAGRAPPAISASGSSTPVWSISAAGRPRLSSSAIATRPPSPLRACSTTGAAATMVARWWP